MTADSAVSHSWTEDGGWNRALEHRSRLGACVLLARVDSLSFRRLKDLLQETDGNLGAHLKRLEDEGFVRPKKTFANRRPVTWYAITNQGRKALKAHLDVLDQIIVETREPTS